MSDSPARLSAEQIAALTPPDRNRYADLLRAASILVVVVGHWLIAVVLVRDGEMIAGRLLAIVPETQWLTWIFQIMPLFFFVGGYANAASWSAQSDNGVPWAIWVRRRARRLLRPVLPLVTLWVPLGLALGMLGIPGELLQLASQVAFVPTWFLAVYLLIVAATPLTWAAHRRWGLRAVVALVVIAVVVDAIHLVVGVPVIGWTNFFWVWAAIHQLGYYWFDERLPTSVAAGVGLAAAGYAVMLLLTSLLGYPIAMLGVEAGQRSNNSPTSVALFALAIAQVGLIVAARRPVTSWLERPAVWAKVVATGSVAMTVYLWHQTALVVVIALMIPTGIWPASSEVDLQWWLLRPLWFALCGGVLIALVRVFAHYERAGDPRPRTGHVRAVLGVLATVAGIGLLLAGGLHDPDATAGVPLTALGLLLAGLGALGVVRRNPPRSPDPSRPPGP